MMNGPAALYMQNSHVPTRFDIGDDLEVRNDLGAYLVPAGLNNPLFELSICAPLPSVVGFGRILPHKPANAAIVFHSQQQVPAPKVNECNEFLRKITIVDDVALELDAEFSPWAINS